MSGGNPFNFNISSFPALSLLSFQ